MPASPGAGQARRDLGLQVAQRHREDALLAGFEDPELAGELRQRRQLARRDLEREATGVRERAAGVIVQVAGHLDAQGQLLGEGAGEADQLGAGTQVRRRRPGAAARVDQTHPRRVLARHRRREAQRQRPQRKAGRVGPHAPAGERRAEFGPRPEGEHLILCGRDAGGRRDAGAPHERDAGARGELAPAAQHHELLFGAFEPLVADGSKRLLAALPQEREVLPAEVSALREDRRALLAREHVDLDRLADALDRTARAVGHRAGIDGTVGGEQEDLPLVDGGMPLVGKRDADRGPAGVEPELAPSRHRSAVVGGEAGAQLEATGHPRREIARKLVGPVAGVDPTAAAGLGAGHLEGIRETRVAECHHRLREPRGHLADAPRRAFGGERFDAGVRAPGGRRGEQCDGSERESSTGAAHGGLHSGGRAGSERGGRLRPGRLAHECVERTHSRGTDHRREGLPGPYRGERLHARPR